MALRWSREERTTVSSCTSLWTAPSTPTISSSLPLPPYSPTCIERRERLATFWQASARLTYVTNRRMHCKWKLAVKNYNVPLCGTLVCICSRLSILRRSYCTQSSIPCPTLRQANRLSRLTMELREKLSTLPRGAILLWVWFF